MLNLLGEWGNFYPLLAILGSLVIGYQMGIVYTAKENFRASIEERMAAKEVMERAQEILSKCKQHEDELVEKKKA